MNVEKVMTKMLLSCKEATFLIEKKSVHRLSVVERFRLYFHVKLCLVCNLYQHQSKTIEKAINKWVNTEGNPNDILPKKVKDQIVEKITEN
ncbi:hypothetical protein [Lunatibacter salilacus]|uniref:hypothetical protein n=1 Tax=Lunatibacter salilacus TaxID=2483804 RepID=UPI00131C1D5F|nr:hypothetical protein [Lunatibacter salilacus]